ncbi:DUF5677 domain-containing protein [Methylomonas fluvii]|uniref:DUF5677 domain-containing protein n=1 Tax=Methylomonas fluvii TaxID=1854564 RepID=UPI001CE0B419|nr:DUF5677 domain-containing protein [Methylomonas fluvii]
MTVSSNVPEVKRVEVDPSVISTFKSEHEYIGLSVELLIEASSYVCIAGNIIPPAENAWNRHEAVLVGHLVRLYKLNTALLDQTCQRRRETTFIFARLAFECIVNTIFIIRNDRSEIVQSYIEHSMRHEKRLRDRIRNKITERGGEIWPIEKRILDSIERSAKNSDVDLDRIDPPKNWAGKNLFDKARDVGLDEAYLGAFAGPSHSIHGNWHDLLEYNLEVKDGGFLPNFEWHPPRPQLLTTIAHLTVITLGEFFSEIIGPAGNAVAERLPDLYERIQILIHLHEEFLVSRTNRESHLTPTLKILETERQRSEDF